MRIGTGDKVRGWNLKIFFSISLAIHLLFLSIGSILFPDLKIDRLPTFNIEVSLLPLMVEEKQVKTQMRKEEKKPLRNENREEPAYKKELEPESPPPVETEVRITPIHDPPALPFQNEEEKMVREPVIHAMGITLPLEPGLTHSSAPGLAFEDGVKKGGSGSTLSNPQPSGRGVEGLTFQGEKNSESHETPLPNISSSAEPRKAVKYPSPSDGEIIFFAQPKYAENPKPIYPHEARKKGYQGEVVLRVEVLSNGQVGTVEVKKSSGYELLDRSALTTVKQWRFIPAKKGENPIPLWVNIPIKFQLQ